MEAEHPSHHLQKRGSDLPTTYVDNYTLAHELNEEVQVYMYPAVVLMGVLMVLGTISNSLVLYIYPRQFKKNTSYYFIICLASFDLFVCVFVLPLEMYSTLHTLDYQGLVLCQILRLTSDTATMGSAFVLVLIACDRYIKIYYPFCYLSPKNIKRLCAMLGLLSFVVNLLLTIFIYGIERPATRVKNFYGYKCFIRQELKGTLALEIKNGFLAILFGTIMLALTFFYFKVWRYITQRRQVAVGRTIEPAMMQRFQIMATEKLNHLETHLSQGYSGSSSGSLIPSRHGSQGGDGQDTMKQTETEFSNAELFSTVYSRVKRQSIVSRQEMTRPVDCPKSATRKAWSKVVLLLHEAEIQAMQKQAMRTLFEESLKKDNDEEGAGGSGDDDSAQALAVERSRRRTVQIATEFLARMQRRARIKKEEEEKEREEHGKPKRRITPSKAPPTKDGAADAVEVPEWMSPSGSESYASDRDSSSLRNFQSELCTSGHSQRQEGTETEGPGKQHLSQELTKTTTKQSSSPSYSSEGEQSGLRSSLSTPNDSPTISKSVEPTHNQLVSAESKTSSLSAKGKGKGKTRKRSHRKSTTRPPDCSVVNKPVPTITIHLSDTAPPVGVSAKRGPTSKACVGPSELSRSSSNQRIGGAASFVEGQQSQSTVTMYQSSPGAQQRFQDSDRLSVRSPRIVLAVKTLTNRLLKPMGSTTTSLFAVTGIFFFCYFFAVLILPFQKEPKTGEPTDEIYLMFVTLLIRISFIQNAVNPFVYAFYQPRFRESCYRVVRAVCCRKRA